MKIVVAYDIFDNKRRRKVEKLISAYGERVNLSVFEIEIKKYELKQLVNQLKNIIEKKDDIRFYVLNEEAIKNSFTLNSSMDIFYAKELYF